MSPGTVFQANNYIEITMTDKNVEDRIVVRLKEGFQRDSQFGAQKKISVSICQPLIDLFPQFKPGQTVSVK